MRAEDLVALASAHGIDLLHAVRLGAPPAKRDTITQRPPAHRPPRADPAASERHADDGD